MKRNISVSIIIFYLMVVALFSNGADKFFVVKISNFAKETEYKVLNEEELNNLKKEIEEEGKLWSKALSAAQKEWQSNEQYKNKPFPTGAIEKRTYKVIGQPYSDAAKAEDKISSIEEQEQERAEREAEREKEKAARLKTKPKEKDKGKDTEKENMYAMARAIFEQKLNEVKELEKKPKEEQKQDAATPPAGK